MQTGTNRQLVSRMLWVWLLFAGDNLPIQCLSGLVECMQEIVSEIKKEQRRLFLFRCPRRQHGNTYRDAQATGYSKTSGSGSHPRIRGRTTTLRVNLGTAEPEHGSLKVTPMQNGSHLVQAHFYGSMENVRILRCIISYN